MNYGYLCQIKIKLIIIIIIKIIIIIIILLFRKGQLYIVKTAKVSEINNSPFLIHY